MRLVLRMSVCGVNKPPKRIPVVLSTGAEEPVLDASFLVLLSGPAQFLTGIAGGYERTVGVVHFLPVQGKCAEGLTVCLCRHSYVLRLLLLLLTTHGSVDQV